MKEGDAPYEKWESYFYSLLNGIKEIAKFQSRVGIALDRDKRTVKEGYLYTADYIAYKKGVELVVYVEANINPERICTVKLGGEGRVVNVEIDKDHKEEFIGVSSDEMYLALSPILAPAEMVDEIEKYIVTGEVSKLMLGVNGGKRNETVTAVLEGSVIYGKLINNIKDGIAQEYIRQGYNTVVNLCGKLVKK
ncbi:type III-B CRISPR module-associated Cmr3 family protein [Acidianus sp. RZ1]|uniref:type III-B CRISPR module-associated Cmr3 family protein n=1 Tax=Acidianus sp. RZ1 TaxID=1540082 RepID=UPI0014917550|nr:type III-B CRISPR module-associated Cmr3 family protein [Acidianus sp. RZ1]NON61256.1 hypothetical protein [Acidianus sp. RZ1]